MDKLGQGLELEPNTTLSLNHSTGVFGIDPGTFRARQFHSVPFRANE